MNPKKLKPNLQRAKNAIILIWIVFALEILSLISGSLQYNLLQVSSNGGIISMDSANANDTREQAIGIIYLIFSLISAVTFILWFRRAYYNLNQKTNRLSFDDSWAAGSWFVPIICLYRPYQMMKELYNETKKLLVRKELAHYSIFSTNSLGLWWTLWIINNLIGQVVFRYSMKAETIDELKISTIASIVGNIAGIFLAIVTVRVIKDYSNVEPLLFQIKEEEETTPIVENSTNN